MNRSSSELKRWAREKLDGNYAFSAGAFLLVGFVDFICFYFINSNLYSYTILGKIIYYLISFLIGLLMEVFMIGLTKFFLNICRKQKHSFSDLIYCFTHQVDRFIIVSFFLHLPSFLINTIGTEIIAYSMPDTYSYLMVSLGFSMIASFISLIIILGLFPAAYLLLDDPNLSGMQAIKKSILLMKGHKGRLLYLDLSFIGLVLLGALTCGIGLAWVMPYRYSTHCFFYLDLTGELDRAPEEIIEDYTNFNNTNDWNYK